MFKKVVVPLDLSELAECALAFVRKLAKDGSLGEVVLLNVVEIDPTWGETGDGFDFTAFSNVIRGKARKYLDEVQARLRADGIKVTAEIIEANKSASGITEYAKKNGADLIIIASHGYTGLKKLMFGSVALNVLYLSHVPVLLLRPESCRS